MLEAVLRDRRFNEWESRLESLFVDGREGWRAGLLGESGEF